jgi:hypothetical protein
MPRGGHFATFEQPELLVEVVRVFFLGTCDRHRRVESKPDGQVISQQENEQRTCDTEKSSRRSRRLGQSVIAGVKPSRPLTWRMACSSFLTNRAFG